MSSASYASRWPTPWSCSSRGWACRLFFMLSGLCLTLGMIRRDERGQPPRYLVYLTERWRRVAPPYYAALVLCLGIAAVAPVSASRGPWAIPPSGGIA